MLRMNCSKLQTGILLHITYDSHDEKKKDSCRNSYCYIKLAVTECITNEFVAWNMYFGNCTDYFAVGRIQVTWKIIWLHRLDKITVKVDNNINRIRQWRKYCIIKIKCHNWTN